MSTQKVENNGKSSNEESYVDHKDFEKTIIKEEEKYINERRKTAQQEYEKAKDDEYKENLAKSLGTDLKERKALGLTFSGGGMRAATFNLGISQSLSKNGILPWMDYLSTISGGGYYGSSLISLLSWARDDNYTGSDTGSDFHFNTQWKYFPFNPEIQAFRYNPQGVDYLEDEIGDRAVVNDKHAVSYNPTTESSQNRQLEHMTERGNFVSPLPSKINRDTLRVVGALVGGMLITILIYLIFLFTFGALQYGVVSGISPEILKPDKDSTQIISSQGQKITLSIEDKQDIQTTEIEFESEPKISYGENKIKSSDFWKYLFASSYKNNNGQESLEYEYTKKSYLFIGGSGFIFILVGGLVLALVHSINKIDFGVSMQKSDEGLLKNTKYFIGLFSILVLIVALFVGGKYFISLEKILTPNFWVWGIILIILFGFLISRFLLKDKQLVQGMDAQNHREVWSMHTLVLLEVIVLYLAITSCKLDTQDNGNILSIYWLFTPAVFIIGSILGFLFMSVIDRLKFMNLYIKYPQLRSMLLSWHGIHFWGLVIVLTFAFVILPQFFNLQGGESSIPVPLPTAIVSGIISMILSARKDLGAVWVGTEKKGFYLPEGLWKIALGTFVILLNLSLLLQVETWLDELANNKDLIDLIKSISFFNGLEHINIQFILIVLVFFASLLILSLAGLININHISLHYMYRDQIANTFLKTTVKNSDGEIITVRDDSDLKLRDINPENCSAPYHLIVCSTNLTGSWQLDQKDRRSEHFIFSRLFSGSKTVGYVDTNTYRSVKPGEGEQPLGKTKLSRAIAISGAAFSSSIGMKSFFAEAFILSLANIRLGMWMLNPTLYKEKKNENNMLKYERNAYWGKYLYFEAMNRVSERHELINISDGGHTGDNGSIYPLLQRRARLIIVGDASQDPKGTNVDLFRAIRMARADLGVEVEINTDDLMPDENGNSKRHYVIGKIKYLKKKDEKEGDNVGWLIYLKPTILKDDPAELRQFRDTHHNWFPHPSTMDQWFDEWQFEAQRKLGEECMESALREWKQILNGEKKTLFELIADKSKGKNVTNEAIDSFFNELLQKLYEEDKPDPNIVEAASPAHTHGG